MTTCGLHNVQNIEFCRLRATILVLHPFTGEQTVALDWKLFGIHVKMEPEGRYECIIWKGDDNHNHQYLGLLILSLIHANGQYSKMLPFWKEVWRKYEWVYCIAWLRCCSMYRFCCIKQSDTVKANELDSPSVWSWTKIYRLRAMKVKESWRCLQRQ